VTAEKIVRRSVEAVGEALDIVRALAGTDPREDDSGWCHFCEGQVDHPDAAHHEPTCLWRQAAEWVAAHPT